MKKKMFGAILCSAALAVGMAMPAFADVDMSASQDGSDVRALKAGDGSVAVDNDTINKDNTAGQTGVYMQTKNSTISVTVPLYVSLYAESAGGPLGTPSTDKYYLQNTATSGITLYVTNVKVEQNTQQEADWEIVATTGNDLGTGKAAGTKNYGKIGAKLTEWGFTTNPTTGGAAISGGFSEELSALAGTNGVNPTSTQLNLAPNTPKYLVFNDAAGSLMKKQVDLASFTTTGDPQATYGSQAFSVVYTVSTIANA